MDGACGLVWSMLVALGAIDPGSNPGRPTIFHLLPVPQNTLLSQEGQDNRAHVLSQLEGGQNLVIGVEVNLRHRDLNPIVARD